VVVGVGDYFEEVHEDDRIYLILCLYTVIYDTRPRWRVVKISCTNVSL